jgi:hypothetical protein
MPRRPANLSDLQIVVEGRDICERSHCGSCVTPQSSPRDEELDDKWTETFEPSGDIREHVDDMDGLDMGYVLQKYYGTERTTFWKGTRDPFYSPCCGTRSEICRVYLRQKPTSLLGSGSVSDSDGDSDDGDFRETAHCPPRHRPMVPTVPTMPTVPQAKFDELSARMRAMERNMERRLLEMGLRMEAMEEAQAEDHKTIQFLRSENTRLSEI